MLAEQNISNIITALATLVAALTAAIISIRNGQKSDRIHNEVKTMNELTIGQLGEATESRRIAKIPKADRTARETRHIEGDVAPAFIVNQPAPPQVEKK